jgi:hypothetical protein
MPRLSPNDGGSAAERLEVRASGVHGHGAFAVRAFAPGDIVHVLDDSRIVDEAHPLLPGEHAHHCDYVAGGQTVLMPSPERYINSSCDPNTVVRTRAGVRRVIALRAIEPGEEVTYDYILNCHGGVRWTCRCGSPRCRGEVPGSFFDLPLEEQRRLWPLLDEWFVAEHARLRSPAGTRAVRRRKP